MKKVTFLFLLLSALVISSVSAQTSHGNMMVGGALSFSTTSYQGNSDLGNSSTTFSPGFGYFVIDNLAVGANIGFSGSTNDTGGTKTERTSFSFGPFARYYKFTSNENFAFF
jgi:outer membrane protein